MYRFRYLNTTITKYKRDVAESYIINEYRAIVEDRLEYLKQFKVMMQFNNCLTKINDHK